ncbi:MAG: formate dehydrogenase accessory sulfurtransferase FdhD, partial [Methanoculleaceae archaeon]
RAGIPVVISRASATDRGIALAGEAGITLICFARKGRFTVYTHPERIEGLPTRKEDIESLEMVSTPCQE